ncbi:hypothetical protein BAUCODRAFT_36537 [Baudoinia panamericana UAMH 10762]|uniref:Oxidoreductase n=1 Tax=Baudoinia panamericana (strain UAMH 10762) TaxID=717646 RepID=M2MC46_BAUPA|nr:uncharacterized protein BAUCODRAFT_36537 [Baudoinia panamericana UAMH 10762]EMC94066.1 hypothetical protein BAUCODRAFT_36537 [Baudoinia panamericana UAMH 10762]
MAPKMHFNPSTEIPSLEGKVILVTGGTAGLGRETILSFAAHQPAHIFFTGRSQSSANSLIEAVRTTQPRTPVTFIPCDLASLAAVQKAAKDVLSQTDRLDIVMLNAGVMALPPGQTKDGYEIQFGTNHVGHALLAKLLTPTMEATAKRTGDVRLIWNTSTAYNMHFGEGIHFDKLKTDGRAISPVGLGWVLYGQSKLANLVYARAYAKHHPSITSVAIHPGVSPTGLVTSLSFAQRMFIYVVNFGLIITPEQCAWNQQWAATAPKGTGERQVESGRYYEPLGVKMTPRFKASNDALAEKLWDWTQTELEGYTV